MLLPFEGVISALIAIFESLFYYLDGVDGLFHSFKGKGLWDECWLWHYYEELEHHCESTYGFSEVYGGYRYLYLLVALPIYLGLVALTHGFALTFAVFQSPWVAKPKMVVQIANHLCKMWGGGFMATLLLMLNLHSKDEHMMKVLRKFKQKFEAKFGKSLHWTTIRSLRTLSKLIRAQ
jgi:hypothetical protein